MGSPAPRDRPATAFQELEAEVRRRFAEFEASDEFPSEAARDLCVWLLTHERLIEALHEARRLIAKR